LLHPYSPHPGLRAAERCWAHSSCNKVGAKKFRAGHYRRSLQAEFSDVAGDDLAGVPGMRSGCSEDLPFGVSRPPLDEAVSAVRQ